MYYVNRIRVLFVHFRIFPVLVSHDDLRPFGIGAKDMNFSIIEKGNHDIMAWMQTGSVFCLFNLTYRALK